ncbi:Hypothetical predicted protein [Mytilus galloprovincialis]|uniref:DUF7042 domain-containing protein n=1 Tax=Mytilus galloprovincialis TaxID=29158 RepID=A0A8B6EPY6_MYTGA|nr:Hypothetical predicted protein [Mytilus galloprovincialis]
MAVDAQGESDREENAAFDRISFIEESIANAGVSISQVCIPTSGSSAEEFHVLVKENRQADVKQLFPAALIGVYAYTVTDASSSGICGTGSVWDACTIKTTILFNYTQCSTQMFGSTDGEFYATKYVTSGSTSYVIIINGDSTTSTRFTCLAVSGSSVSSNPGSCEKGQVATSRTSDAASLLISLSVYESTQATPASPSYVMIIVGVVVALIVLIACVIGCIVYHKYKKKSRVQNGNEENANNPGNDPSAPNVVAGSQTPREINNSLQSIEKQVPPLNAEIH